MNGDSTGTKEGDAKKLQDLEGVLKDLKGGKSDGNQQ